MGTSGSGSRVAGESPHQGIQIQFGESSTIPESSSAAARRASNVGHLVIESITSPPPPATSHSFRQLTPPRAESTVGPASTGTPNAHSLIFGPASPKQSATLSITSLGLGAGKATIEIGDPTPAKTPDAVPPALSEEAIALHRGRSIMVINNHYVDPLSGHVFSINYGTNVAPKDWEECTRILIGSVWEQIEGFALKQGEHGKEFQNGLKDIKGYQFDWVNGTIAIEMKSGVTHTINTGTTLREVITPFLSKQPDYKLLPAPATLNTGLQGFDPPLSEKPKAFLLYLIMDPSIFNRLKIAIEDLRTDEKRHKDKIKQYQVLLDALMALKTGATTSIKLEDSNFTGEHHSVFSSIAGIFTNRFKPKLDDSGDPWLRSAVDNFEKELSLYCGSSTSPTIELLDVRNVGICRNFNEDAQIISDLKSKLTPASRSLQIGINGNAHGFKTQPEALPSRPIVHIEPQINLGTNTQPKWADVTQITCLVSEKGTLQNEATYLHFIKHNNEWWKMDGSTCSKILWSEVQQMASLHASKIGFSINSPLQASLTRERSGAAPQPPRSSTASTPTVTAQVLDAGSIFAPGISEATPAGNVWTGDHAAAMIALRRDQAELFSDDAKRAQVPENYLSDLYFPALRPMIRANPGYIGKDDNTFTPEAHLAFKNFFMDLSKLDQEHKHVPKKALCYCEVQHMANISGKPIIIITGPNVSQRMIFTPNNASFKDCKQNEALFFGAPSLDAKDPKARANLSPLKLEPATLTDIWKELESITPEPAAPAAAPTTGSASAPASPAGSPSPLTSKARRSSSAGSTSTTVNPLAAPVSPSSASASSSSSPRSTN